VRVEGLSKSAQYNGLFGRVELKLQGERYRVVLEQDAKVLSLKGDNLMPVDTSVSRDGAAGAEADAGGGLSECIKEADMHETGAREEQGGGTT
jgi:hypothetical protein